MPRRYAPGFDALPAFPLAGIAALRRQLEAQGVDVIDLGAGDADMCAPPAAVAALQAASADPAASRYAFQLGSVTFRKTVAAWMKRRFGVTLDPFDEILPLLGSKEGIAHLAFALVAPGDTTVIPDPGYPAYSGGTLLAGGRPYLVPLATEHEFLVPFGKIPQDVRSRLRIVYLNYPNNPTTACASREYLQEAVAFCARHDAVLAYDNAYSEICFDGYRAASILEIEGARDVAIEFHSLSKTYNMTGWRIAWAAGGAELISALSKVKSYVDTGAFLAVQAAGAAALESYDAWVPRNVEQFRVRRDAAVAALRAAGFAVEPPRATLYLWVPLRGSEPSANFARRALEREGVVVMPGSAFGAGGEGYFRIALTVPPERLREAASRLGHVADR
ncbi:MAG: aminotransferase class I/II-fold pyridoxal phosphate-dependent enzyme [Gemmatimonadetes bacterium]|nr:aminotransferase class I/II-fold pyridoxal phosphate-dependent enzyme [Gemmatimonadota bacterium]